MATWRGITFEEHGEDGLFPTYGSEWDISVRHVPGGDGSLVQSTGRLAPELSLSAMVTEAQLNSLRAAGGVSGALSFSGGSGTYVLRSIAPPQRVAGDDLYYTSLSFVRLA